MTSTEKREVKIGFRDEHGEVETLWALDLGDGRYQLDNLPWFQYGVSWLDIVAAEESDGMLFFTRVLQKSGHRTLRVSGDPEVPQHVLDALVNHGCTFEGATPKFIAIDVAPHVDFEGAVTILLESGLEWEYADPTYGDIHGAPA